MNYSKLAFGLIYLSLLASCDLMPLLEPFGPETQKEISAVRTERSVTTAAPSNTLRKNSIRQERTAVYRISDVDVVPLYGMPCGATMRVCNQKNIAEFIYRHIELPEGTNQENINGLEFVKVIVESDGSVRDIEYVETKNENCNWCEKAAVNVVQKMSDWKPALKNGKTVPVQIIIPIQFLG